MKILEKDEARRLYLENSKVRGIFDSGYKLTMDIANPKLMNDKKVRPNSYLVNDEFENNPMYFSAYFTDRIYKVIRCVYVKPEYRASGYAKLMIGHFKEQLQNDREEFLQIGVEATNDETFTRLNSLYLGLGFIRNPFAVPHSNNKSYYDYFWAEKPFEVVQDPLNVKFVAARFK